MMETDEAQTQTSYSLLPSAAVAASARSFHHHNSPKTNFIQILTENDCLFKNYLLLKLIKYKSNATSTYSKWRSLEDQLFRELVVFWLNQKNQLDSHTTKSTNNSRNRDLLIQLLNDYRQHFDPNFYLICCGKNSNTHTSPTSIACTENDDETKKSNENPNQSSTSYYNYVSNSLKNVINNVSMAMKSIMETNANDSTTTAVATPPLNESIFKESNRDRLDSVILDIVHEIFNLAKKQFKDMHAEKGDSSVEERDEEVYRFRVLIKDLSKLIEMNRACLNNGPNMNRMESKSETTMIPLEAVTSGHDVLASRSYTLTASKKSTSQRHNNNADNENENDNNSEAEVLSSSGSESDSTASTSTAYTSFIKTPTKRIQRRISAATTSTSSSSIIELHSPQTSAVASAPATQPTTIMTTKKKLAFTTSKNAKFELDESALTMNDSVEKLPGIGKTYEARLREKQIYTVADLVNVFERKCESNELKFETKLKRDANLRNDTLRKVVAIVQNFSNSRRSQ